MKYIIAGDPVPLARPRHGKGHFYDKQKHLKLVAGINLKNQHDDRPFYEGRLHLKVAFFLKIAKKMDVWKLNNTYHCKRPDLSNMLKYIEDVGTGILYTDDAIICSVEATKWYSDNPCTEFEIREL